MKDRDGAIDEMFRRSLQGEWKPATLNYVAPLPWTVRKCVQPTLRGTREEVFAIFDHRNKFVAECENEWLARQIVEAVATREGAEGT